MIPIRNAHVQATVYLCTRGDDQFAVKVFSKKALRRKRTFTAGGRGAGVSSALDAVAEEVAIMKKLDHPNLVSASE